jgi:hypothetical protein
VRRQRASPAPYGRRHLTRRSAVKTN